LRHFLAAYDLTSRELTELVALSTLDPDVGERVDYAGTLIATVLANAHSTKDKRFKMTDFLPSWRREKDRPLEAKDIYRMLTGG